MLVRAITNLSAVSFQTNRRQNIFDIKEPVGPEGKLKLICAKEIVMYPWK